jgi:hypothetical protein
MISNHDGVSDSKLAEWQVDISGNGKHVTSFQHYQSNTCHFQVFHIVYNICLPQSDNAMS